MNNRLRNLGDVLLYLVFLLVLGVGIVTMLAGYVNFCLVNEAVRDVNLDMHRIVASGPAFKDAKSEAQIRADLALLEAKSKSVIDPNSISFLFQIFSFALVSGGVWLLKSSSESVELAKLLSKKAEETANTITQMAVEAGDIAHLAEASSRAAQIGAKTAASVATALPPMVDGFAMSVTIGTYLGEAYLFATLLSEARGESSPTYLTLLRETTTRAREYLRLASEDTHGHPMSYQEFFVDCAGFILQRLDASRNNGVPFVDSLISDWKAIMNVLSTTEFVSRYNQQLSALTTGSEQIALLPTQTEHLELTGAARNRASDLTEARAVTTLR